MHWRPLHAPSGLDCRIERLRVSAQEFPRRHELSRPWSPFNYSAYARSNRGEAVLGVAFGRRVELDDSGAHQGEINARDGPRYTRNGRFQLDAGGTRQTEIGVRERAQFLIERLAIAAELVERLPPDLPLPPPPDSATARGVRTAAAD